MSTQQNEDNGGTPLAEPIGSTTVYDKRGCQILPGDTLKMYHFRAALRRERRFMYKFVLGVHPSGKGLVISHLNLKGETFFMLFDGKQHDDLEVVQGYEGVPMGCDFRDRRSNTGRQVRREEKQENS